MTEKERRQLILSAFEDLDYRDKENLIVSAGNVRDEVKGRNSRMPMSEEGALEALYAIGRLLNG